MTARRVFPLTRWLLAAAAVVALAAAVDAGLWWRDAGRNAQIASGQVPADSPVPELQFAHAQALTRALEAGAGAAAGPGPGADPGGAKDGKPHAATLDAALNAWRPLQAHPTLGLAARYNSANLLLRQASALRSQGGGSGGGDGGGNGGGNGGHSGNGTSSRPDAGLASQALPLAELAKEQYRELLRRDPGFWEARYNLERAQRLLPDPVDSDLEPTAAQRERESAATRMRAQSLGLP